MKTKLTANKIRNMYIDFFKSKGHTAIPSASLIPENDPTVLFTTAGMHPLVPYLLGEKHPAGKRLVDVQKCLRTGDIDSVGDSTHCTFLEMLGNWSLGDYFKEESITWSYEFLTSTEWLNIDIQRLHFTVFEGDENAPKDEKTYNKWIELGVDKSHLYFLGKEDNWWGPAGQTGPCGPDTEIFYDTQKKKCSKECMPGCSCGKYVEIWNNVFMEYNKGKDGSYSPLSQRNVDTGMGLERLFATLLNAESVYSTELFANLIDKLEELSNEKYDGIHQKSFRIIADHIRTAVFVLSDETPIVPTNNDQGYILRRIIRRAIRHLSKLGIDSKFIGALADIVINDYKDWYIELEYKREHILQELNKEEELFSKTISQGVREFEKLATKLEDKIIPGKMAFRLFDTFGFPIEFTEEMAQENGYTVDIDGYKACFKEHQEKSRKGAENRFKGGLADNSIETTRLHTATHILHKALRNLFGESVEQKGSNITAERLRFDFKFDRKMTPDEITLIEDEVNKVITSNLKVSVKEMTFDDAKLEGAIGLFENKYNQDNVKVYSIGDFSKEVCGGPHVENTGELGQFKILKESSSSSGVRRIKAVLL